MTSIMNQVTCSLCDMKMDESQWKEHLVSNNHFMLCKKNEDKIAIKFFGMIFNACLKKSKIYDLENEKTHDFWQLYFSTKLAKGKFYPLCGDSLNNTALEINLSSDFQDFIQKVAPDIAAQYFYTMDKIVFCKICSVEIIKPLLFDHINS